MARRTSGTSSNQVRPVVSGSPSLTDPDGSTDNQSPAPTADPAVQTDGQLDVQPEDAGLEGETEGEPSPEDGGMEDDEGSEPIVPEVPAAAAETPAAVVPEATTPAAVSVAPEVPDVTPAMPPVAKPVEPAEPTVPAEANPSYATAADVDADLRAMRSLQELIKPDAMFTFEDADMLKLIDAVTTLQDVVDGTDSIELVTPMTVHDARANIELMDEKGVQAELELLGDPRAEILDPAADLLIRLRTARDVIEKAFKKLIAVGEDRFRLVSDHVNRGLLERKRLVELHQVHLRDQAARAAEAAAAAAAEEAARLAAEQAQGTEPVAG